jgi:exopolysaccharide production protein ExoZ
MAQPLARIHILQGLRAYAAVPVALLHTDYTVKGMHQIGNFGVSVFFLLSGYIMASICATDTDSFLRRRMIRVIPSYWLTTIVLYCLAAKFPHLLNATQAVPVELLKSLLFIPFMKQNGLLQPILFIGWTINYEMLFYVVLALSLVVFKRMPLQGATAILLSIMGICSLFARTSVVARFYSDPIILEFILGLIAFYCVQAIPNQSAQRLRYIWAVTMIICLIALPLVEALDLYPAASPLIRFGLLSFLLIWSSCLLALGGNDIRPGLIVLIGDASYVLYLTHFYVDSFLEKVVARRIPVFHVATTFGCVFSILVAIGVSILLYLKMEKPALNCLTRRFCRRAEAPRPILISVDRAAATP